MTGLAKELSKQLFTFLEKFAEVRPDYDPEYEDKDEKFTSPDASILFAAATLLNEQGVLPHDFSLFSSWGSGGYKPYDDTIGQATHAALVNKAKSLIGKKCPVCEKGTLIDKVEQERQEHKGQVAYLPLYFSECTYCKSDIGTVESSRKNKENMLAFKAQIDQLSPEQIELLEKFGYLMRKEIITNNEKGDFVTDWDATLYELLAETAYHMAKLNKAMIEVDKSDNARSRKEVSEFSADIANYMAKISQIFGEK